MEEESTMPIMGVQEDTEPNRAEQSQVNELEDDGRVVPKWQLIALTISLCFGLFLSLLDTTIVATALYTIGVSLHSTSTVNWVALSYTLSYLGCTVVFARLADITGRRNAYTSAFLIFFAFSLGCGFSNTIDQLIACRTLQGVGGAGLYSLTFIILAEIYPPRLVQWIGAVAGGTVAVAGVLGPVLGGIITRYTTWRWVFWINAPIGILPLIVFVVAWPKPHQLNPIQKRYLKEMDFIGCTLIVAASVLVVFALQQAGIQDYAWNKAIFLAPMIIGCVCWIALVVWQIVVDRLWEDSIATIFPLRLLKNRVFMAYVFSATLMGFPYFLVIYALPLRLQVVNGKSPLTAGISLLPLVGSVAIASALAGGINSKKNNSCITLVVGSCFMLLGTSLMTTLSDSQSIEPRTYGFQVFIGLGFGLTVSTVSMGAVIESEVRDTTVAQGIIAQFRMLGGSIGIAATTAILGVTQRSKLAQLNDTIPSTKTQTQATRAAHIDAFKKDMVVCAIVAGVCVFINLASYKRNTEPVLVTRARLRMEERQRLEALRLEKTVAVEVGQGANHPLTRLGSQPN